MKKFWKKWKETIKDIVMVIGLQLFVGYMILEVMSR
ncbi:hypothetical protein HMPREF0402_02476 [Fusobacterium ulcerans 12-1B]|uniref:Uncharacterized protein n=1 Tax=Fusobacterium ulcerans 12-1B TaxID=457404 RepID=H1PVN3_9FUSO|nr:hypothetical protein HMPREF0402_02476 [Fusobacterium ulcerans 12-1B]